MSDIIRIDVRLGTDVSDSDAQALAEQLKSSLDALEPLGNSEVVAMPPDRSLGDVLQIVAIAAPVVKTSAEALKALVELFKSLQKTKKADDKNDKSAGLLSDVAPENILVRVGRKFIPLNELTAKDLEDA